MLSFSFVDTYAEHLQTQKIPFVEGVYEGINAAEWSKNVMKYLNEFLSLYVNGDQPLPGKHFPAEPIAFRKAQSMGPVLLFGLCA